MAGDKTDPVETAWKQVVERTVAEFGMDTFTRVAGKYPLREELEVYLERSWPELTCEADAVEAAGAFYDRVGDRCRVELNKRPAKGPKRRIVLHEGSLWRVAAYGEALPAVLRAREEVLGTREPLPRAEAVDWLVRETQDLNDHVVVEVGFRFLVPKKDPVLGAAQSGMPGPELLDALEKAAVHTRIAPGARRPYKRPTETSLRILIGPDDERIEVDLFKGTSDRLSALLSWARRLAGRCVGGATSEEMRGYGEGLAAAIWLILAGIWPRVSVEAIVHSWRGSNLIISEGRPLPQTPYMLIRVEAMDMPPRAVADAYRDLRREVGLGRPGKPLEVESEALCMAALDAEEIDQVLRADPRFLSVAIRRYKSRAEEQRLDPDTFSQTKAGHTRAREVLDRADESYRKLLSRSIFDS